MFAGEVSKGTTCGYLFSPLPGLAILVAQHSSKGASKYDISFLDGFETELEGSSRQFFICVFDCSFYCFAPSQDVPLFSSKTSDNFPSKFA